MLYPIELRVRAILSTNLVDDTQGRFVPRRAIPAKFGSSEGEV